MDLEKAQEFAQEKYELGQRIKTVETHMPSSEEFSSESRLISLATRVKRLPGCGEPRRSPEGFTSTRVQISFNEPDSEREQSLYLDLRVEERERPDGILGNEVYSVYATWFSDRTIGTLASEYVCVERLHKQEAETQRILGLLEESVTAAEVVGREPIRYNG